MANDREISYELALELANFSKNVELAVSKVNTMDKRIEKALTSSNQSAEKFTSSFKSVATLSAGLFAAGAVAHYANEVRKIADEYQNVTSRLKLVTDGSNDLAFVQNKLYQISQATGTKYADNASSYAKLAFSMRDVGASSNEILGVTEMVNKSLIVNGSTTEMAGSFMLQFSQAMGSGVLQGDEFRAMLESNSYFANLLTKALGTNIAGLRQMSKDGKLTSDVLRDAFPKMAAEINANFDKMPKTTAMAMQALENAFGKIVNESNKASDGTGTIAKSISDLAQTIDSNREGIISLFSSMISLAAQTTSAMANIGQSFAGWKAVGDGRLGILEFATMDAKELNAWLKQNANEISILDGKIAQLKAKQKEVASQGYYTQEGVKWKKDELAAINQQIASLEKQKLIAAGVAESQKRSYDNVLEWGGKTYRQLVDEARKSASGQQSSQENALKAMKSKYQEYATEVKRLQADIANRQLTLAEKIREMNRSVMSDSGAWADRKKEAEEYISAAEKAAKASKDAFAAGDDATGKAKAEEAVKLYDKAGDAAADLNREVKDGDKIISSQAQNLKVAVGLVTEAQQGALAVEKSLAQNLATSAQAMNSQAGGALAKEFPDAAKAFESIGAAAKAQTEVVNQEITKIGNLYTNMNDGIAQMSAVMAERQKGDIQGVGEAHNAFIEQVKQNLAYLQGEVEKGIVSQETIDKIEELKEKLKEVAPESSESTGKVKEDISSIAKSTEDIGDGFSSAFDAAINDSFAATEEILSDISRIKKAAASIKYPTPSSDVPGYATGGIHRGGWREVGENGRELEFTGPSRIIKASDTRSIISRLNGLMAMESAGAVGQSGGSTYNLTVNVSGGGQSNRDLAKTIMNEWQKMHRGRS